MKILKKDKRNRFKSRRSKLKKRVINNYPIIKRDDVMELILSTTINEEERAKLSRMYNEIIKLETNDLKYITHITVSNRSYAEIYNLIAHHMGR